MCCNVLLCMQFALCPSIPGNADYASTYAAWCGKGCVGSELKPGAGGRDTCTKAILLHLVQQKMPSLRATALVLITLVLSAEAISVQNQVSLHRSHRASGALALRKAELTSVQGQAVVSAEAQISAKTAKQISLGINLVTKTVSAAFAVMGILAVVGLCANPFSGPVMAAIAVGFFAARFIAKWYAAKKEEAKKVALGKLQETVNTYQERFDHFTEKLAVLRLQLELTTAQERLPIIEANIKIAARMKETQERKLILPDQVPKVDEEAAMMTIQMSQHFVQTRIVWLNGRLAQLEPEKAEAAQTARAHQGHVWKEMCPLAESDGLSPSKEADDTSLPKESDNLGILTLEQLMKRQEILEGLWGDLRKNFADKEKRIAENMRLSEMLSAVEAAIDGKKAVTEEKKAAIDKMEFPFPIFLELQKADLKEQAGHAVVVAKQQGNRFSPFEDVEKKAWCKFNAEGIRGELAKWSKSMESLSKLAQATKELASLKSKSAQTKETIKSFGNYKLPEGLTSSEMVLRKMQDYSEEVIQLTEGLEEYKAELSKKLNAETPSDTEEVVMKWTGRLANVMSGISFLSSDIFVETFSKVTDIAGLIGTGSDINLETMVSFFKPLKAAWAARSNKNDYKAQDDFEQKQEELIKQAQGAKLDLGGATGEPSDVGFIQGCLYENPKGAGKLYTEENRIECKAMDDDAKILAKNVYEMSMGRHIKQLKMAQDCKGSYDRATKAEKILWAKSTTSVFKVQVEAECRDEDEEYLNCRPVKQFWKDPPKIADMMMIDTAAPVMDGHCQADAKHGGGCTLKIQQCANYLGSVGRTHNVCLKCPPQSGEIGNLGIAKNGCCKCDTSGCPLKKRLLQESGLTPQGLLELDPKTCRARLEMCSGRKEMTRVYFRLDGSHDELNCDGMRSGSDIGWLAMPDDRIAAHEPTHERKAGPGDQEKPMQKGRRIAFDKGEGCKALQSLQGVGADAFWAKDSKGIPKPLVGE